MARKKKAIVKSLTVAKRLEKIDQRLRKALNTLQDVNLKLCHLIKQHRENFYKANSYE